MGGDAFREKGTRLTLNETGLEVERDIWEVFVMEDLGSERPTVALFELN
jgi:hypothetical protein